MKDRAISPHRTQVIASGLASMGHDLRAAVAAVKRRSRGEITGGALACIGMIGWGECYVKDIGSMNLRWLPFID